MIESNLEPAKILVFFFSPLHTFVRRPSLISYSFHNNWTKTHVQSIINCLRCHIWEMHKSTQYIKICINYILSRCHIMKHGHYRHKSNGCVCACVWLTAMNMNQIMIIVYVFIYSICVIEIDGSVKFTVRILFKDSKS